MSNAAAVPTPVEDIQGDGRWMSQHGRFSNYAKGREPEVLLIGDSLIQQLQFTELWDKFFVPLHSLNFGVGGDQTQNVLWRIQNGELENIEPKIIILLVGTNNYNYNAAEVADGIMVCTRAVNELQPQAQIIVMGLPPRGEKPNKLRDKMRDINAILSGAVPNINNAQFFAVDPALFVSADGFINHRDMYDYLHFTETGYRKLFEPLLEEIEGLLKNFMTADSFSQGEIDKLD